MTEKKSPYSLAKQSEACAPQKDSRRALGGLRGKSILSQKGATTRKKDDSER